MGAFFIVSETSLYIPEHRSHSALYSITAECGCGDSSVSGWYSRSPFEGPGENVIIIWTVIFILHSPNSQLRRQTRERRSYGKGVTDILVKADSSLPSFVALVLVFLSLT